MICKIEIRDGYAFIYKAPDVPLRELPIIPAHLAERRFAKGEPKVGFFRVESSLSGIVTNIGDRVEKPKGWP